MSSIVGEEYTNIVVGMKFFDEEYATTDPEVNKLIKKAKDENIWPEVAGKTYSKLYPSQEPRLTYEVWLALSESLMEVCNEFDLALD